MLVTICFSVWVLLSYGCSLCVQEDDLCTPLCMVIWEGSTHRLSLEQRRQAFGCYQVRVSRDLWQPSPHDRARPCDSHVRSPWAQGIGDGATLTAASPMGPLTPGLEWYS